MAVENPLLGPQTTLLLEAVLDQSDAGHTFGPMLGSFREHRYKVERRKGLFHSALTTPSGSSLPTQSRDSLSPHDTLIQLMYKLWFQTVGSFYICFISLSGFPVDRQRIKQKY
ncbi:hypothetical protein J6590_000138 [Homalodisca vitripennis]|nr:hypothetical protein J6590_000138 [Homalodisca vitripennis]